MKIHYNYKVLDVDVDDNSYRHRAIKGDNSLTLYYSLAEHVELPVGAYCEFEGDTYTLEQPENFTMQHSRNFEYTLVMESAQSRLRKYKFRNKVDKRLKFSLTAKPQEYLQVLVDNLNGRDSGWVAGECIVAVEKPLSFNHASCEAALSQIAEAFETEWEIAGKTIHLRKLEYNKDSPLSLSYGRGKGFKPGVGRTNFTESTPIEILFVQGGEKNIDASKYGNKELLLPKGQTLKYDGKYFEGESGFKESQKRVYMSDADGYSVHAYDKPSQTGAEDSLDLSHIYPSRVGIVTAVETTKEGFCDFFDNTIPQSLDYSLPESRYKGETMAVVFQSGMLAGKTFEIQQNENTVFGYVHSERRFKVVEQLIDGEPMPKGNYMPVVGDKYVVIGTSLPEAYVCDNDTRSGASWEMMKEAVRYLYENESQKFTFTGELDGIWAKKNWSDVGGKIRLGGYISFSDVRFQAQPVLIRIVGIKDFINNPHSPEIELSNSPISSSIVSDLRKIESNEVVGETQYNNALQFTKRRFRDAQETSKMLENALLNFSGSVNPVSVNTMQLLVGSESSQFQFVDSKSDPKRVNHNVVYDNDNETLSADAAILQHLTLGVRISTKHKAEDYKYWDISAAKNLRPADYSKGYYLYVMCENDGTNGSFILSDQPKVMDPDDGYYYFLYGVLNSEYNEERSFVAMIGFTEITPGRITVSKIANYDGDTYFDLEKGEIGGNIQFVDSSGKTTTLIDGGKIVADAIAAEKLDASKINAANLDTKNLKAGLVDTRSNLTGEGVVMYRGNEYIFAIFDAYNRMRTQFNRINPGLEFYNVDKKLAASISENGITMPRDAKMNMPGVLSAGRVNYEGAIEGKWGAVDCYAEQYYEGSVRKNGYFKITHLLGHSDYFVQITGAQLWQDIEPIIMGTVISKNDNEVIIAISASNSKTFVDAAFEYCIIGKNR